MEQELQQVTVSVRGEQHLLSLVEKYRRLWTFPQSTDRAQIALHERMLALQARGAVRLVLQGERRWEWERGDCGRAV